MQKGDDKIYEFKGDIRKLASINLKGKFPRLTNPCYKNSLITLGVVL